MPGTFTYTVATNIVVVTAGTSGAPATFADFVTADRAGTDTFLKTASAPSKTYTLTYAVRPVELRALIIKFVISAKTAEADYLFITGTDAWDAAQTESIDVTAGNGTYTSTKRFRTITNISCSDAADGTGTLWADGTLAVTQDIWGVIWNKGNSQYQVDSQLNIGDASTSTFLTQQADECVVFPVSTTTISVTSSATFTIGAVSGSYSGNGAFLKFPAQYTTTRFGNGGTILVYGSIIHHTNNMLVVNAGTFNVYDSIIVGNGTGSTSGIAITSSGTVVNFRNVYLFSQRYMQMQQTPVTFTDVWVHTSTGGIYAFGADATCLNATLTTYTNDYQSGGGSGNIDLYVINPTTGITAPAITNAETNRIWEQYYCNINVCDKDGVAISGAVVDCEDQFGTAVWAAGTVTTNASGNITQKTISTKLWTGTAETLTTYAPHKFTISKTGYETLVLNNITITSPVSWHLELQAPSVDVGTTLLDIITGSFEKVIGEKVCMKMS